MRHTEIAKSPCHGRYDGQQTVWSCVSACTVMNVVHGKVTGQGGCIVYDLVPATGHVDTVKYNDDQRDGHNNTLDAVSGRHCHKAAHDSISYNNNGAYDHGDVIICSEQAGEQGSDSLKAGGGVRNKDNQDDDRGDAHQDILLIMIPFGKEIRDRDRITGDGIAADTIRHDQPV